MNHAIRIHETGGPEVLKWEEADPGTLGPGQVLLRHTAIGLNFIDTYHRSGLYPLPELPAVLGREGVGKVEKLGEGVTGLKPGDRVAYPLHPGSYSEAKVIPADLLVPVPDNVTDKQAAAMLLKGLTAHYLLRRIYPVGPDDTILIHAAAGGVGLIACQWASHLGATVIGTVGNEAKAGLARAHGCHHPVVYSRESFVDKVRELTDGAGLPAVFDSVGKDTFDDSLDCLAPMGIMVSFGQSSGPVPTFDPGILARKGSLFLTRPTLAHYIARREDLISASQELFGLVRSGAIRVNIGQTYPLKDAARAHRDLESRKTSGSTVLIP